MSFEMSRQRPRPPKDTFQAKVSAEPSGIDPSLLRTQGDYHHISADKAFRTQDEELFTESRCRVNNVPAIYIEEGYSYHLYFTDKELDNHDLHSIMSALESQDVAGCLIENIGSQPDTIHHPNNGREATPPARFTSSDNTTATDHEGLDTMNLNDTTGQGGALGEMTSLPTTSDHPTTRFAAAPVPAEFDNLDAFNLTGQEGVEAQEPANNMHDAVQEGISTEAGEQNTFTSTQQTGHSQIGMQGFYNMPGGSIAHLEHQSMYTPTLSDGTIDFTRLASMIQAGQIALNHDLIDRPGNGSEENMTAYARLDFPDVNYYVHTFAVKLGRDLAAAKKMAQAARAALRQEGTALSEPQTPKSRNSENVPPSALVTEGVGGLLRHGDDTDGEDRRKSRKGRSRGKRTKSTRSTSVHRSRRSTPAHRSPESQIQDGPVAFDKDSRPSPFTIPVLPIHAGEAQLKSISRDHAKIEFNPENELWELKIRGTNGAFVNEVLHHKGEIVPLMSGSVIQIGGVPIRFVLPDRGLEEEIEAYAEEQASNPSAVYEQNGKAMSFDFEKPLDPGLLSDTPSSDESRNDDDGLGELVISSEDEASHEHEENEIEDDDDDDDENEDDDERDAEGEDDGELDKLEPGPTPQKKRGPGRPPKNGVMSKREQQEAKRAAQQKAKNPFTESSTSTKPKGGKPGKNSVDSPPTTKTEKRKYTKRKPKEPGSSVGKEGGSEEEDKPAKEKKEKKSAKPPRSPSPVFNEAELTPEQLAKPAANYVTLIHEALSSSPHGAMSLPQIYRAMVRKHPYFKLRMTTTGWQSSVRHNLSQHSAFRKVERDGKGWLWAIVDGVPIEKDKKQRHMSPPPPGPGPFPPQYQGGPPMPHGFTHAQGMIGPHGPPHQQYYGLAPPPHSFPYPPPHGSHPLQNGNRPYMGPIAQTQLVPPQNSSYSSPYGNPTPPPPPPLPPAQQATGPPQQYGAYNGVPQQQQQQHRPPPPPQQQLPISNDKFANAIALFKKTLIAGLKNKEAPNPEVIVESAINRVLGKSQVPIFDNPHEQQIMMAAEPFIRKLQSSMNLQPRPDQNLPPQGHLHPQGHPPGQGNGQAAALAPNIPKPPLGLPRPNGVLRPPMMNLGTPRKNSGSPALNSPQTQPALVSLSSASSSTPSASPAPRLGIPGSLAPTNIVNMPNPVQGAHTNLPAAPGPMPSNTNSGPNSTASNFVSRLNMEESIKYPVESGYVGVKRPLEDENSPTNHKRIDTGSRTNGFPGNPPNPVTNNPGDKMLLESEQSKTGEA